VIRCAREFGPGKQRCRSSLCYVLHRLGAASRCGTHYSERIRDHHGCAFFVA